MSKEHFTVMVTFGCVVFFKQGQGKKGHNELIGAMTQDTLQKSECLEKWLNENPQYQSKIKDPQK